MDEWLARCRELANEMAAAETGAITIMRRLFVRRAGGSVFHAIGEAV